MSEVIVHGLVCLYNDNKQQYIKCSRLWFQTIYEKRNDNKSIELDDSGNELLENEGLMEK